MRVADGLLLGHDHLLAARELFLLPALERGASLAHLLLLTVMHGQGADHGRRLEGWERRQRRW